MWYISTTSVGKGGRADLQMAAADKKFQCAHAKVQTNEQGKSGVRPGVTRIRRITIVHGKKEAPSSTEERKL